MSKFKLSDIQAGYLLRVRDLEENQDFNMTVVPTCAYEPAGLVAAVLAFLEPGEVVGSAEGDLACCSSGDPKHFWPLDQFNEDLNTKIGAFRVISVYGRTDPALLLDNSTQGRELLWERPRVDNAGADEAAVEPEPKAMTLAEIEAALGHSVRVV